MEPTTPLQRRDVLKAAGAAAVLSLIPHRQAFAIWTRVTAGAATSRLGQARLALVASIADTIIPRTDTPSATDVGVPAFVDVVVGENYSDSERAAFIAGLEGIGALGLEGAALVDKLEGGTRDEEPSKTYWRLKSLIVHAYFTSEPVMKDVLEYEVAPGKFDGAAPMRAQPAATHMPGHPHA